MRIFKHITTMCFRNGMMPRAPPLCDVRLKKEKKDRGYLMRAELELFINYKPENKRLERVKDRFVFCCTGFDFSTTASLTPKNIVQADDGSTWIETHRVKTSVASKVKLLDIPLSILKKYEDERVVGYLLLVISNAKYN